MPITYTEEERIEARKRVLRDLEDLVNAAGRLSDDWTGPGEEFLHREEVNSRYPFRESFDELVRGLAEWLDAAVQVAEHGYCPECGQEIGVEITA